MKMINMQRHYIFVIPPLLNGKPAGTVVSQQPFGGSRASGTNDKAGSMINLLKWTSPRATKELFVPPKDYRYPFMEEK